MFLDNVLTACIMFEQGRPTGAPHREPEGRTTAIEGQNVVLPVRLIGNHPQKSMEATAPEVRVTIPHALRSLCGPAQLRNAELRIIAHDVRELLAELARQ